MLFAFPIWGSGYLYLFQVFYGMCLGQPVAVKTMFEVTEDNVKDFRAEILLTATLRHPVRTEILRDFISNFQNNYVRY
jgi:hypothetical protein